MCACGSMCSNLLKSFSASILTGGLLRSRSHSAGTNIMHLYPPFLCGVEFILCLLALPAFTRIVFFI